MVQHHLSGWYGFGVHIALFYSATTYQCRFLLRMHSLRKIVQLPAPDTGGGIPLMQALSQRQSTRDIDPRPLPAQELSNLLWATWGVNRPTGHRTAPTSQNRQAIVVYVAIDSGVWYYDGVRNELVMALDMDVRANLGGAPVTLLYAAPPADYAAGMHVGSLYQNAGLYCASAGLANVVQRMGNDSLKGILPLPDGFEVFVIQRIGYPAAR